MLHWRFSWPLDDSGHAWAELICQCFNLDTAMVFTGKDLVKMLSLHKSKYLRNMMDVDCCNVHHDHIWIFHDKVKLKGSRTQHCFFTCKSGKAPQTTSIKWYKLISDGKDLKTRYKLRGAKWQLMNSVIDLTILEDCHGGATSMRLRPQTNQIFNKKMCLQLWRMANVYHGPQPLVLLWGNYPELTNQ